MPILDSGRHFVLRQNGARARLVYRLGDGRLVLEHTNVPEELAGGGIGAQLVRTALERARRESLTVVPECAFASAWLRRHPEVTKELTIEWPATDR